MASSREKGRTKVAAADGADKARSDGPRRSALLQERSRRTRHQLVRAALKLWTERGFERGIDETTVDEIVKAAGVTKGTFYFHFTHKEGILLELGWGTAEVMFEEATKFVADDLPMGTAIDKLMRSLARRVELVPKAAVARSVAEFYRMPAMPATPAPAGQGFGFRQAFTAVFAHGRQTGELPKRVDGAELGRMLEALTMDAIVMWARGDGGRLAPTLRRRAALLVAGAQAPPPTT